MDKRRTQRVVTDLRTVARIRVRSVAMLIYDLSRGGCMVEVPETSQQTGDNLRCSLGGSEYGGTVVWEQKGYAGVKFFRDLASEIVTLLGFKPGKVPFKEVQPRDCFGRPMPALSARSELA